MTTRRATVLLDLVGDTPLLQVTPSLSFKLEYQNPFRSLADRFVRVLYGIGVLDGSMVVVDCLDALALSAIGLTRPQKQPFRVSADIKVEQDLADAAREALRLWDITSVSTFSDRELFTKLVAQHWAFALRSIWAEILAEVVSELQLGERATFVLPLLTWNGLGGEGEQLSIASEVFANRVKLVRLVNEVEINVNENSEFVCEVTRSQAEAAVGGVSRRNGVTPHLLGGAVIACSQQLEACSSGRLVGVLADSAEWYEYKLTLNSSSS